MQADSCLTVRLLSTHLGLRFPPENLPVVRGRERIRNATARSACRKQQDCPFPDSEKPMLLLHAGQWDARDQGSEPWMPQTTASPPIDQQGIPSKERSSFAQSTEKYTTSCTSVMKTLSQVHRQPRQKSVIIQLSRHRLGQQMSRLARRLTPAGPLQTLSSNVNFHNHLSQHMEHVLVSTSARGAGA